MTGATELPHKIGEFVDLAKEYLRQETLEPAKQLGRFIGFSLAAALTFAIGGLLLSIAALRGIVALLPDGPNWSALGYIITAVILLAVLGSIVAVTAKSTRRD